MCVKKQEKSVCQAHSLRICLQWHSDSFFSKSSLSLLLPIESRIRLDPGPRITLAYSQDLVIWVGRANKRPGAPLKEGSRDCPSEGEVDISILCSDLFFCDCFPIVTI